MERVEGCFVVGKYHIYVVNNLPVGSPAVSFHCASGDNDFGKKSLGVGEEFSFGFCKVPQFTLFFCHFWWEGKEKAFVAFDASWHVDICKHRVCYYAVKADGFYFSPSYPPKDLTIFYKW
ncbi:hypothetical protein C2S52_017848 [Perilla frutescens var. hirtella]|nr:hypothetical protein C2S52_017848 [Perilla frutescens var. hirtella]KAH6811609.1 hypothetical protein C2S51_025371 [Perilla frutescens var. frutescens]